MLTIVLPIKNHREYLERLLSYYCDRKLEYELIVADSSDGEDGLEIRRAVDAARSQLKIEYRAYAGSISVAEKLADALDAVTTDFVVAAADDDFFTISGLQQAAEYLKTNRDFSVVHGQALIFELDPGPVYGNRVHTAHYIQRSIEDSTGAERLLHHFRSYSTTWYSVHRTPQLRRNMQTVAQLKMDPAFFTELLAGCLAVIQGKTKKLDALYMVRQAHREKRESSPSVFDWVTGEDWSQQYHRFQNCLAQELARQESVSARDAAAIVKKAFWLYLAQCLTGKWHHAYSPRAAGTARLKTEFGRHIRSLPAIWQRGRSLLPGEENQALLPSLLRTSSPYHAEFMPIYRALAAKRSS